MISTSFLIRFYPRGTCCLAASISTLPLAVYCVLGSLWSGAGNSRAAVFMQEWKPDQSALRKFHRLTGFPGTGSVRDGTVISEGRWCERGNLSSMRRSGSGSDGLFTAKAKSGLVYLLCGAE